MGVKEVVKISNGNIKLGNIPNINLPPILTCYNSVPCASEGCYALKAYKQYPNVRSAWHNNLEEFKNDSDKFFNDTIKILKRKKTLKRFRWHSSGDIVDQRRLTLKTN